MFEFGTKSDCSNVLFGLSSTLRGWIDAKLNSSFVFLKNLNLISFVSMVLENNNWKFTVLILLNPSHLESYLCFSIWECNSNPHRLILLSAYIIFPVHLVSTWADLLRSFHRRILIEIFCNFFKKTRNINSLTYFNLRSIKVGVWITTISALFSFTSSSGFFLVNKWDKSFRISITLPLRITELGNWSRNWFKVNGFSLTRFK